MTAKPIPQITDFNRPYYEGCERGELRIRRCLRCEARFRFAHYLCPNCWSSELSFEKVSGRGKVATFSVVHQAPYEAFEDVAPYVLALIDLEEGVRIMSNVVGCKPDAVRIGLAVSVTFEKRGSVYLPMFVPVGSGAGQ